MKSRYRTFLAGCSLTGMILASAGAVANEEEAMKTDKHAEHAGAMKNDQQQASRDLSGPEEDVQESAEVLTQLSQNDPELAQQLADAKGLFVIPDYATAALLIGGSGGEGVLLTNQQGQWGNPGFYDIGNIDIGLQAGGAAGAIVLGLMSDQAMEQFRSSDTEFSLTADAGLTIVNWSADAAAATSGDGDVLVWTDTEGLLAEASVGVGGISWDEEEAEEYYGQSVEAEQVIAGDVQNPHEEVVQSEFAEFSTSLQSGMQSDYEQQSETEPQTEYDTWPEDEPQ